MNVPERLIESGTEKDYMSMKETINRMIKNGILIHM